MAKREVQKILKELECKTQTAADLNNNIVIQGGLCSTSSLYRRLTELHLTGLISKNDKYYSLTDLGKKIQGELKKKLDPHLSPKLRSILRQFLSSKHSVSDMLYTMKISPNELTRSLRYLKMNNYLDIEVIPRVNSLEQKNTISKRSKPRSSSSRGRPKKVYKLTKKGKKSLDDLEEFEESLK